MKLRVQSSVRGKIWILDYNSKGQFTPLYPLGGQDEISGNLPYGWQAKLYRDNELLDAVSGPNRFNKYVFKNVDLQPGLNNFIVERIDPRGNRSLKEISKYVENSVIEAGEVLYIPDKEAAPISATCPCGENRIVVMVFPEHVEFIGDEFPKLDFAKGGPQVVAKDYADRLLHEIVSVTGVNSQDTEELANWAFVEHAYTINER